MPVITFKVSPEEARVLRARAKASKAKSLSDYIRRKVLEEEPAQAEIIVGRHPISGLLCNLSKKNPVSQAEIDAALADFP